jgi:hypothetical protein
MRKPGNLPVLDIDRIARELGVPMEYVLDDDVTDLTAVGLQSDQPLIDAVVKKIGTEEARPRPGRPPARGPALREERAGWLNAPATTGTRTAGPVAVSRPPDR